MPVIRHDSETRYIHVPFSQAAEFLLDDMCCPGSTKRTNTQPGIQVLFQGSENHALVFGILNRMGLYRGDGLSEFSQPMHGFPWQAIGATNRDEISALFDFPVRKVATRETSSMSHGERSATGRLAR